jgi:hypothetical protein
MRVVVPSLFNRQVRTQYVAAGSVALGDQETLI